MINKIKEIEQEKLDKMLEIGLQAINHKNLFGRIFTHDDIKIKTSYDGVNLILELKDSGTVISVSDANIQRKKVNKTDEYTKIHDSPLAEQFHYHVYLNNDLVLFIHDGNSNLFKNAVDTKIFFYNEDFELAYIHEGFYLINDIGIKYLMTEFYIGYDFDKDYNPVAKLFVGNQREDFNGIADKYRSKFVTYREGFNVKDENLLLRHYLFMEELYNFDEIFTQFYGPLPKPLDMELVNDQLKLASMVLFNK